MSTLTTPQANPRPWYREPWPWLLIGLPAAAVIASLASAYLAIQGADPIIEDNYYQRGLDINTTLERVHHAAERGVHASVQYDGLQRGATIWVRVRSTTALHDPTLQIRLIHPARSGADRHALLARVPSSTETDAEYTGQWLDDAPAGAPAPVGDARVNWRIALQGADWQIEGDALGREDLAAR